ncbi:MAG: NAD(P)-dependent oxidoreductase [Pseudomonadota bacterium]
MARLAFIGLGVMGAPMAGFLAKAGHELSVYNRSPAKAESWLATYGGRIGKTPAQAAEGAEIVFACVGNDRDVEQICIGPDGAFDAMGKDALFVDHTTASAQLARTLHHEAARRDLGFLDAPVSGGQSGAEQGILTVMCGGEQAHFNHAQPLIQCYARMIQLLGGPGSGQLTKMVNQICIAGLVQGLSEALAFGSKAGLDIPSVLAVLSKGAAQSWQMENRGLTMDQGEFDFGFAVDWMRKDLGICLAEARELDAQLPVTALIDQFYSRIQAGGGGRLDTSSLIKLLR